MVLVLLLILLQHLLIDKCSTNLFYVCQKIYRLKGYVRFRDTPETTYLFQFAYGMPDYEPIQGNNTNTVVLIGENLDKERLRNQLDALQFT